MRFLVDTHVLLWAQLEPNRLSPLHKDALAARGNEFFFSAASIWEIAIKSQLKRSHFNADASQILTLSLESGMRDLPVTAPLAARVGALPMHHADPFDRVLIAQAIDASLAILTVDSQIHRYRDLVRVL